MTVKLALLLLKSGCAAWAIATPSGDRIVMWACPPPVTAPAAPGPAVPPDRET